MIATSKTDSDLISGIIRLIVPNVKIYAFGSRANGTQKPYSDLDIVLKDKNKISFDRILDIKNLLEASPLEYSVDIIDWYGLSEDFRNIIQDDLVEIK